MEIMTLAGIGLALAAILGSFVMDGGQIPALIHPNAMILILGGTLGAAMTGFTMKDMTGIPKVLIKAFMPGPPAEPAEAIQQMVHFADRARRDGLLALEEDAKGIDDPFLRKGIQLAIDGTDPEIVREVLETEIAAVRERHKVGAKFFMDMGAFSPTLG